MKLTGKKILYAGHVVTVEAEDETHCRIRFESGTRYVIAKTGVEPKNIINDITNLPPRPWPGHKTHTNLINK